MNQINNAVELEVVADEEWVDPHPLTPEQEARMAAYLAKPRELPKSGIDMETGRALPISQEELDERWAKYLEEMAEIDAMGELDPPDTFERLAREINEDRRQNGERPVFREP